MAYTGSRFQDPLYEGDGTGEVEKDAVKVFHLLELHFEEDSPSPLEDNIYLTDNFHNIGYDSVTAPDAGSQTYLAAGRLLAFGSVSESTQIKINTISVNIGGITTGDISDIIHNNIVNKRVVIYRSFGLQTDSASDFNDKTYMLFDGNIKNFTCSEGADESIISFNVASHWANFEATNGRFTNKHSQLLTKAYNTTETFYYDLGFDWSSSQVQDIRWGPTGQ